MLAAKTTVLLELEAIGRAAFIFCGRIIATPTLTTG
jgi:hypothetical protein